MIGLLPAASTFTPAASTFTIDGLHGAIAPEVEHLLAPLFGPGKKELNVPDGCAQRSWA
jgi:hypothetical protein